MKGAGRIRNRHAFRAGKSLGQLECRFVGNGAAVGKKHRLEVTRRDGRKIVGQCSGILRQERHADLMALFFLETAPCLENARVIVSVGDRAESAEHVQDRAIVLIVVVHPFGALHQHLVETENLEVLELPWVQVFFEQRAYAFD